jgi:hypothetical protein
LKTLDFDSAVEKLSDNFKGAGAQELTTYTGQMRVLGEAADNAQEIIGTALVDSFSLLAGEANSVQPLADAMADLATYIGDATYGLAALLEQLKSIPGAGILESSLGSKGFLKMLPGIGPALQALDALAGYGQRAKGAPGMGGYPSSALGPGYIDPNDALRKKAEAAAIKRAKELAALQKKTLDTQKKSLALQKASKTIDLERIGIEAALKGEISKTDRLSLNLQLALLDKNEAAALKLSGELSEAVKRQKELAALLLATPKAPNPYDEWVPPKVDVGGNVLGTRVPNFTAPSYTNPYTPDAGFLAGVSGQKQPVINIEVIVDGEAVGGAVRNSSVNSSLSGSFNSVNRSRRFAEFAIE